METRLNVNSSSDEFVARTRRTYSSDPVSIRRGEPFNSSWPRTHRAGRRRPGRRPGGRAGGRLGGRVGRAGGRAAGGRAGGRARRAANGGVPGGRQRAGGRRGRQVADGWAAGVQADGHGAPPPPCTPTFPPPPSVATTAAGWAEQGGRVSTVVRDCAILKRNSGRPRLEFNNGFSKIGPTRSSLGVAL